MEDVARRGRRARRAVRRLRPGPADGVAVAPARHRGRARRRRGAPHRRRQGDASSSTGRPLLHYPLAVLRAVARRGRRRGQAVDRRCPALDAEVAIWLEADEPRHPLAGIVHALRCARRAARARRGRRHAVRHARRWSRALARERSRGAPAVVPRAAGRLQPLCARYDPRALTALAGRDFAAPMRDVVAALSPRIVEWPDDEPFFNVNRPEDILQAAGAARAAADARRRPLSRRWRSSSAPAGRSPAR